MGSLIPRGGGVFGKLIVLGVFPAVVAITSLMVSDLVGMNEKTLSISWVLVVIAGAVIWQKTEESER